MDDFGEAETAGRRTRAADILLLVGNWRAIFWCLTAVVANSVAGAAGVLSLVSSLPLVGGSRGR